MTICQGEGWQLAYTVGHASVGRYTPRGTSRPCPAGCSCSSRSPSRRAIVLIAHLAGVPGRWAPLVIGGALGLMTALVAGAPPREDGEG